MGSNGHSFSILYIGHETDRLWTLWRSRSGGWTSWQRLCRLLALKRLRMTWSETRVPVIGEKWLCIDVEPYWSSSYHFCSMSGPTERGRSRTEFTAWYRCQSRSTTFWHQLPHFFASWSYLYWGKCLIPKLTILSSRSFWGPRSARRLSGFASFNVSLVTPMCVLASQTRQCTFLYLW